jgi:hypothetical protein
MLMQRAYDLARYTPSQAAERFALFVIPEDPSWNRMGRTERWYTSTPDIMEIRYTRTPDDRRTLTGLAMTEFKTMDGSRHGWKATLREQFDKAVQQMRDETFSRGLSSGVDRIGHIMLKLYEPRNGDQRIDPAEVERYVHRIYRQLENSGRLPYRGRLWVQIIYEHFGQPREVALLEPSAAGTPPTGDQARPHYAELPDGSIRAASPRIGRDATPAPAWIAWPQPMQEQYGW